MAHVAVTSTASGRRFNEDWLALWIGLLIFVLALGGLKGVDLLGWVVTTSVWTDFRHALGTASKDYGGLGGLGALIATYVVLLVVLTAGAAILRGGCPALRGGLHRGLLDRLRQLDHRQLCQTRGRDTGRLSKIRHRLVAAADGRGRLRRRPAGGPRHREFFPPLCRLVIGGDPSRALHQDSDRDPRRLFSSDDCRQAQPRDVAAPARHCSDRGSLFDLLGGHLLRRPQMVRIQPGMGGAAGIWHLDLRSVGGNRDWRCN